MSLRNHAEQIIQQALAAAMPDEAVRKALNEANFSDGKVVLIAAGKAAWQMAHAACQQMGERIDSGVVITKYKHSKGSLSNLQVFEAGHPVPDENSYKATQAATTATTKR